MLRLLISQCPGDWSQNPVVWLLLPPGGGSLASHPSLCLALRVPAVHFQLLVHSPVVVALEEKDLSVVPGEGCVRRGRQPANELAQRLRVERKIGFHLIKLPVVRSLHR